MSHLLRRFVCGRCGATAPLSDRPYQECASCQAVGDYDYGVARRHLDWPRHEARLAQLRNRFDNQLASAAQTRDRDGYAAAYTALLRQLIHQVPALFPSRAVDGQYRDRLAAFHGMWQAMTAIEPSLVRADHAFRARREEVVSRRGRVQPETLWPLIDHAAKHAAEIQRIVGIMCEPPDDFVPDYIKRFVLSVTVAEWLPQLRLEAQRELVNRLELSHEYVEPAANTVRCSTCGGTVEGVAPGFGTTTCPYCTAHIHETRGDFREIELERYEINGYDLAFGGVALFVEQPVRAIQVLDGPVTRKGKAYRMITLRAVFADRSANFWRMYDVPDSKKLAAVIAWLGPFAKRRDLPVDRFGYREHPACSELPRSPEDLSKRLAESGGVTPYTVTDGAGSVVEVFVDGATVRLVFDGNGKRTKMIRAWLASCAPPAS